MPQNKCEELDGHLLARVDERSKNTSEKLDDHVEESDKRFERVFGYIKDEFSGMKTSIANMEGKLESRLQPTEKKVDTLWDEKNTRDGALGLGKYVAGAIGGIIAVAGEWLVGGKHGGL